jgi:CENP-B N-terminal DNA-binding domain
MGRPHKLTAHQQKVAIKRRDRGEESLTEIGRSYNVSGATISRLLAVP